MKFDSNCNGNCCIQYRNVSFFLIATFMFYHHYVNRHKTLPFPFKFQMDLVCSKGIYGTTAQSIYFAGVLVGAFSAGQLSDLFGRKIILIGSLIGEGVFGLILAFMTNYYAFVVIWFFVGIFENVSIGLSNVLFFIVHFNIFLPHIAPLLHLLLPLHVLSFLFSIFFFFFLLNFLLFLILILLPLLLLLFFFCFFSFSSSFLLLLLLLRLLLLLLLLLYLY